MTLTDLDWEVLLNCIQDGNWTPFSGAGANYPALPLGSKIAND